MKHGIYDIPFADYLNDPAFGSSDLRAFRIGPPAMVQWKRQHRHDDTGATVLGRAAHCAVLTPNLFAREFVHRPTDERGDFRTKAGKAWRDEQTATILTEEDRQTIAGVLQTIRAKRIEVIRSEQSIFWTCSESKLACKSRPDWFDLDATYDLKVSVAADKPYRSLMFHCYNAGWLHQAANARAGLAANGINVKLGRLVVVSPNAPHFAHLLEVSENDLDFLELDNQNTRKGMAACVSANHWPGTPDKWQQLELPASAAFTENDLEGAEEALPL